MMKKAIFIMIVLCAAWICPAGMAQNLLINPGFETWDAGLPTDWLAETGVTITQETAAVYEGTFSVAVERTGSSNRGIYQLVTVTPHNFYEFSVFFNGSMAGDLGIYVNWLDSGGTVVGGEGTFYNVGAGAYELVSTGQIEAPDDAVTARCRIRAYRTAFCGYADAASFTAAVPATETPVATGSPVATETPVPTATPHVLTIHDVQFTTDPLGISPYNGQVVTVTGIVTAFRDGRPNMFIQDGPGEWSGIVLYSPSGWTGYDEGDELEVTGEVYEYNEKTEIQYITEINLLTSGNLLPDFVLLSTDAINDERYEGVLCRVENVTVVAEPDTHNEWQINDGIGICVVDDMFYFHDAVLNDVYGWVQGPLDFYTNVDNYFRIEPRKSTDIDAEPPSPTPSPSPAPTCGTELLVNGDMETWTAGAGGPPDLWTSSNAGFTLTQDGTIFYDGDYSTLMTKTVSGNQTMQQILTYEVKSEALYTLSVRVLDNDPDGYARAWVVYYDALDKYLGTSTLSQKSVDDPAWQELLTVSDSPTDAIYGIVRIRVYNEDGNVNEVTINADAATLIEECAPVPTSTPATPVATATPSTPTATPTGGPIPTTGPIGLVIMLVALGGLLTLTGLRRK